MRAARAESSASLRLRQGNAKAELRGHLKDISSLAFTPDGQTLLSASERWHHSRLGRCATCEGKVCSRVRSELNQHRLAHLRTCALPFAGWPPSSHRLHQSNLQLWDTLRLAEGERHPLPFTNTTIAAVAPGGRLAAFGSRSGEVMLWDVETGQARFFARPGTNQIHRLVFSLDGRYLAAADNTKTLAELAGTSDDPRSTVRVWDVGARKETRVFSTDGEFRCH